MAERDIEVRRLGRFVGMTELVGLLGLLGAVIMLVDGQQVASGLCLVAAAVAYGLGMHALVRR